MQFINPIWLWGLTGLLIPIGIHLLSRKESRIIKIGSIRHLEPSHTKQSVNLRLNELLLLAIRCLMIALLVLLLSGLHLNISNAKSESWLLIERGMEKDTEFISIQDSLQNKGFKVKYLEEGFPEINSQGIDTKVNYWSLVEKLSSMSLEKIVVLSYGYTDGFKGERIATPTNLTWLSIDPSPIQFPATAIRSAYDSVSVREANSSANETTFKTVNHPANPSQRFFKSGIDSVEINNPDTLTITFVTDPEFRYDEQILIASLHAVEGAAPAVFDIKHVPPDQWAAEHQTDWLVWLTVKELPTSVNTNSIVFREIKSTNTSILESEEISGNRWLIKRLNEEIALKENLPLRLAFILLSKEKTEQIIHTRDRRVQPEQVIWSLKKRSVKQNVTTMTSGHTAQFLIILIFISLLTERLIAFRRNQ